jgi:hypothetical protein
MGISVQSLPGTETEVPSDSGWRLRDIRFTAVHPPDMTPSPSLVREIRTLFPYFVPLWTIREWRSPAGTDEAFGYHLFGTWSPTREDPNQAEPLRLDSIPSDFPFKGGYVYEARTWSYSLPMEEGIAGPYADQFLPFDSAAVEWFRCTHQYLNAPGSLRQKWEARARAAEERKFKELAGVALEKRLQLRDERHWLMKLISAGKIHPDPHEAQPFLHLRSDEPDPSSGWATTSGGLIVPAAATSTDDAIGATTAPTGA